MKKITLEQLKELNANLPISTLILDVRSSDEFREGHLDGAINIPLGEESSRQAEVKEYENIVIYCLRGGRAQKSYTVWSGLEGSKNIEVYADGGFHNWKQAGYPISNG